jgi:NAD(P)H dehydrogenase (quinone)
MEGNIAIIGAAGKVGFATAIALRSTGRAVRAILRDAVKAPRLTEIGCEIAVADLHDSDALATAIGDAEYVQIIVPPALQVVDTAAQMREAIESLATALEIVRPQRVLAISDYGAHIDRDIGMPSLCRSFEKRIAQIDGSQKIFLRSAEHMEGWGRAIPAAIASGTLMTFHDPVDLPFPTISAPDLGTIAADLWQEPIGPGRDIKIVHAEGPRRYCAEDVAVALSNLLGNHVKVESVPRAHWQAAFESVMNTGLADLLIKANDAQNQPGVVDVEPNAEDVRYGRTELIDALKPFVPQAQ